MSVQNLTRKSGFNQKKRVSVLAAILTADMVSVSADNYLIAVLPENASILAASVYVKEEATSDSAATAVLGTTAGGSQILSACDLATADVFTGTFTGKSDTGTGVSVYFTPTWDIAQTTGIFVVEIEYLEYELAVGELTNFSNV